jgi:hypothetical protein
MLGGVQRGNTLILRLAALRTRGLPAQRRVRTKSSGWGSGERGQSQDQRVAALNPAQHRSATARPICAQERGDQGHRDDRHKGLSLGIDHLEFPYHSHVRVAILSTEM